ncbi:hypothetical protein [Marinomonas sp. GJ51-6]|uniref:hypothetical protein n=1 Tax=Marinomonas sp. GJ51-6 TaxID=2992802 RepID=UPI002934624A|nr:hypothetical protein [Marinomonas sp. GJ51-6]WOD06928.1 hypothetical protein ONZ50_14975 [Marinomonas sp. GJ51-6]
MKRFCWLLGVMSFVVSAQTIERKPVDIIYGNQLIRSEHQVVLSSPDAVSVIPVEQVEQTLGSKCCDCCRWKWVTLFGK